MFKALLTPPLIPSVLMSQLVSMLSLEMTSTRLVPPNNLCRELTVVVRNVLSVTLMLIMLTVPLLISSGMETAATNTLPLLMALVQGLSK